MSMCMSGCTFGYIGPMGIPQAASGFSSQFFPIFSNCFSSSSSFLLLFLLSLMRYLECVYKAGRRKQRGTDEGRDGREISLCLCRRWHRGKSFSIDSLLFFVFSLFATGHVVLAGSFFSSAPSPSPSSSLVSSLRNWLKSIGFVPWLKFE